MKKKLTPLLTALTVAVIALAAAPNAQAIPTIRLFDGTTTITVADGSGGDSTAAIGAVTFNGAIGAWIVNVSTGVTKPLLGSATKPDMDLNSVNVSGGAGGTLTILFSDDGFGPTLGNSFAQIGGTINNAAGSTLAYTTFASASNALFALTTPLTSQSFVSGAFSGSTFGSAVPITSPYSLTQKVVIRHAGAGASSFNASLTVPDGGTTASMLGFALMGIAGLRRKLALA
jgi:hypothetical protein